MKLFAEYKSEKNTEFDSVHLVYSWWAIFGGNPAWFCRIWRKNWVNRISRYSESFGESYGRNKFEAYREALKDLKFK